MMACERLRPGRSWPRVEGWWPRAIAFSALQALAVLTLGQALDERLAQMRPWTLPCPSGAAGTVVGALAGYFVLTFVYYVWHRARHEVPLLWRWLHQLHHSPRRLEVATSFYKHPLELASNSVIPAVVLFLLVGLEPTAAAGATALAGLAELFYHWNVRTPRWVGFFIQRPESHCVHHATGVHAKNYGDLPLWDMLFGTFENPATFDGRCGFDAAAEARVGDMLAGRDVVAAQAGEAAPAPARRERAGVAAALLALGLAQILADAARAPSLKAVAAATAASPAPKVFTSVRGYEALSTSFALEHADADGTPRSVPLDGRRVAGLRGPYNRRNVYGAALAFGPVLWSDPRTRPLAEAVVERALLGPATILPELGIDPAAVHAPVRVRYTPRAGLDLRDLPATITLAAGGDE
ncbi:MAG: sterol desaturase family protein [Planctomycetes bacterium]|nr:sterol desaturase family protein [Planctomycetota bacterium]